MSSDPQKPRGLITLITDAVRTHPEMVALGVLFVLSAGVLLFQALGIDWLLIPFSDRRY